VRISYADNGNHIRETVDINDYYPFGMNHLNPNNNSNFGQGSLTNYKYNSKELQEFGFYDYGWRQYMPDIGRWNGIDQLAEKYNAYSPYNYVMNNPAIFIDPDGRGVVGAGGAGIPGWMSKSWNQTWSLIGCNCGGGGGGGGGGYGGGGGGGYTAAYFNNNNGMPDWLFDLWNRAGDGNMLFTNNDKGYFIYYTVADVEGRGYYSSSGEYMIPEVAFIGHKVYYGAWNSGGFWDRAGKASAFGNAIFTGLEKSIYNDRYWVSAKGEIKSTKLITKGANGKYPVRGASLMKTKGYAGAGKAAGVYKAAGRVATGISIGVSIYEFGTSDQSGADYARLTGSFIILGTAAIPVVGPFISVGLGIADSFGAFDGIYNSFDE
jgi:RHS repeat-associated protein